MVLPCAFFRSPRAIADVLNSGQRRATHCAEHTSNKLEAGDLREHLEFGGVYGSISAAGDYVLCLSLNVAALHKYREGSAACVQRALDYLGALRDEYALRGVLAVEKLRLGVAGVYVQLGSGKVNYFNDIGHTYHLGILVKFIIIFNADPVKLSLTCR